MASWLHVPVGEGAGGGIARRLQPRAPGEVAQALVIYLNEEKDEFVRAVLVQCSLWATALELAFVTTWGCLQIYFPSVNERMPRANYWAFVLWWVAFAAVQPLVRWRYK